MLRSINYSVINVLRIFCGIWMNGEKCITTIITIQHYHYQTPPPLPNNTTITTKHQDHSQTSPPLPNTTTIITIQHHHYQTPPPFNTTTIITIQHHHYQTPPPLPNTKPVMYPVKRTILQRTILPQPLQRS